jgi:hypothetical protein
MSGLHAYAELEELDCEDCGGTGIDPGGLDPFGEICPSCQGLGKEIKLKKGKK